MFNSYKDNKDCFAIKFEKNCYLSCSKQDKFALIIHQTKQKAHKEFHNAQNDWGTTGYMKHMDEQLLEAMKKQFIKTYK